MGIWLAACGGRQIAPPDDALSDPVEVFEAMLTRLEGIGSTRMRATLEYYGDEGRARVDQAVLARAPSMLRIETLSPFDSSLSVFMVAGDELTYYDLQARQYVRGSATPENVSRFVPFWMTAEDLVRVLFGGPPLDAANPDPEAYTMEWDGRAGAYRLRLPLVDGGSLNVLVRHGSWVLAGATQRDASGDVVFELRAGDFVTVGDDTFETEMPQRLRFLMESENIDISLDVTRLDLNVALPDALFSLPVPAGAEVVELP